MNIAEELMLGMMNSYVIVNGKKIFNDTKWWDVQLDYYAACGIIADLILEKKLVVDDKDILKVTNTLPTKNTIHNLVLDEIIKSTAKHTIQDWINILSDNDSYILFADKKTEKTKYDLHMKLYLQLEKDGYIETKKMRLYLIIPAVKTEVTDKGCEYLDNKFEQYKSVDEASTDEMLMMATFLGKNMANILQPSMSEEYKAMNDRLEKLSQDNPNRLPFLLSRKFLEAWEAGKNLNPEK